MYCTVEDLRKSSPDAYLIQATDDLNPNETGSIQVDIVEEQIALACGIIDGYLESVATLPLQTVPVIVKKIAIDLSLHGLYERLGRVSKDDPMDMRKQSAMALLDKISKRLISIGPAAGTEPVGSPVSGAFLVSSGSAEFSDQRMASLGGSFFSARPF